MKVPTIWKTTDASYKLVSVKIYLCCLLIIYRALITRGNQTLPTANTSARRVCIYIQQNIAPQPTRARVEFVFIYHKTSLVFRSSDKLVSKDTEHRNKVHHNNAYSHLIKAVLLGCILPYFHRVIYIDENTVLSSRFDIRFVITCMRIKRTLLMPIFIIVSSKIFPYISGDAASGNKI